MRTVPLLALILAGGCVVAGFGDQREDDATVSGVVDSIALDAASGDVTIRVDPALTETRLTRTVRWSGDAPCLTSSFEEGALTLSDGCHDGLACAVDYVVALPAAPAIVRVTTGSGDVTVRELAGEVSLETGSGDVVATGLAAPIFTAIVGSGDVDLGWVTAPDDVDVETGSGDATLDVPAGTYRIDASTGSGDLRLDGVEDGDAGGLLHVETGSGDVVIHGS